MLRFYRKPSELIWHTGEVHAWLCQARPLAGHSSRAPGLGTEEQLSFYSLLPFDLPWELWNLCVLHSVLGPVFEESVHLLISLSSGPF